MDSGQKALAVVIVSAIVFGFSCIAVCTWFDNQVNMKAMEQGYEQRETESGKLAWVKKEDD